jgi:amino-acid N-acetyltransferase
LSNIKIQISTLNDVNKISFFLEEEVKKGIILHRDVNEISQNIRSYILAKDENNNIIAIGALHIHTNTLGEIRSLMVKDGYRGEGIGTKIVSTLLNNASSLKLNDVLVLTYQDKLFKKLGFNIIDKENIPTQKIWQDCIKCKFFPKCEEISLIKTI